MRPSRVLRVYCAIAFLLGLALCVPMILLQQVGELSPHDAAILTLCWNTFFLLVSPLLIDWSERTYFHARFVQLEELAQTNPELKAVLEKHCEKLALPGLRLAAVDTDTVCTYGLWRQNPRLIVPSSWLIGTGSEADASKIIPTIEGELNRFASRDLSIVFLIFAVVQFGVEQLSAHVLAPHAVHAAMITRCLVGM